MPDDETRAPVPLTYAGFAHAYDDDDDDADRAWASALIAGAGGMFGLMVALLLGLVFFGGGPIFPLTVAFAPLAVVWELIQPSDAVLFAMVFGGGPLLYASYTFITLCYRWRGAIAMTALHAASFAAVCWIRDV